MRPQNSLIVVTTPGSAFASYGDNALAGGEMDAGSTQE